MGRNHCNYRRLFLAQILSRENAGMDFVCIQNQAFACGNRAVHIFPFLKLLRLSTVFLANRVTLLRSRARADALYRLLPQAARSLMAREKQMPLSASLVFLSCSLYSTIGLKGNTVNGMTFKPIQIWYYSSLVASWEQISHSRENLLPGNYEGSAIS